jgi:hypothetical protein
MWNDHPNVARNNENGHIEGTRTIKVHTRECYEDGELITQGMAYTRV